MIPIPALILLVLAVIAYVLMHWTKFGRYVYAIGGNRDAAIASGVNVYWITVWTYVISGIFTGVAALIMTAKINASHPNIGTGYETDAIAACVVGGVAMTGGAGTLFGTQVGAFIIAILSNILNLSGINSYAQLVAKGIVILVAVYLYSLRDAKKGIRFMRIKNRKSNENSGI